MPSITVIQRVLPHYRHAFFDRLHNALATQGVELNLLYGQEQPQSVPRTLDLNRAWTKRIHNTYVNAKGTELVWQPCMEHLAKADLVIVEQANRLILNYRLALRRPNRTQKIAFWGHGRNMQASDASGWRERFKRNFIGVTDWWFAYTELSAKVVRATGFAPERITVVQNAIDTGELVHAINTLTTDRLEQIKADLNIQSNNICLYCGGMYPDKKLAFLLEACSIIKTEIPDFHMLFIGEGPDRGLVKQAAQNLSWVHDLGPIYGADRVPYFLLSKAVLSPGGIGLIIVDSFVTRTPLITTALPLHGPEIAYLTNQVNGLMTAHDTGSYANAVTEYLRSPLCQAMMRDACAISATQYTLDNMVNNFCTGILQCLESPHAKKGAF